MSAARNGDRRGHRAARPPRRAARSPRRPPATLDQLLPESDRLGRRFVAVLLGLVALALSIHGGFNALVDPYDIYDSPLPLERAKTIRALKLELLRRTRPAPEALILGSSRVRMLDPARAGRRLGVRFFHAGGPVGGTADWLSFARYAIRDLGYPIRLLLLGVDAPSFSSQPNLWLHPVGHPELRPHLRHPYLTRLRSWVHVWSPEQTAMSWQRLTERTGEEIRRAKERFAGAWSAQGFRRVNPPLDREQIFQGNVELHRSHHEIEPSHRANFEALAELAAEHGVTVISFLTPEAPRLRRRLEQTHYPAARERTEEILRAAADSGVIFCDLEVLRLRTWDFVDPHHLSYRGGLKVLQVLELCAKGRGWRPETVAQFHGLETRGYPISSLRDEAALPETGQS